MRPRLWVGLETMTGFLLVLLPVAGVALAAAYGLALRRRRRWGQLALVAAGGALPFVVALAHGRIEVEPLWIAVMVLLGGALLTVRSPRALATGLLIGFVAAIVLGTVERERSRDLWSHDSVPTAPLQSISGISRLSGDADGWRRNGVLLVPKSWFVPQGSEELELAFELHRVAGPVGWQWYTNDAATRQTLVSDVPTSFTRIEKPVAYIVRRAVTADPVAGLEVRATLQLRASRPTDTDACGLAIRSFEPFSQGCGALRLTTSWRTYQVTHRFPSEATLPGFEVALQAVDVEHLDVRDLVVEVRRQGDWAVLGPLEPAGALVRVPILGRHLFEHPAVQVLPGDEGRRVALTLDEARRPDGDVLEALIQLEAGVTVELDDVRLRAVPGGDQPVAQAVARAALAFGHPNLAGHVFAATGALGIGLGAAKSARGLAAASALAAAGAILLTGSRAAWLGIVLAAASIPLAWRSRRPRRSSMLMVLLLIALISAGAALLGGGVRTLTGLLPGGAESPNAVPRVEIWRVAWTAIAAEPLRGVDGSFADAWRALHPLDARPVPQHAHQLWLEWGVRYGVPGILAAVWLTLGLLVLVWRARRWSGIVLLSPVLVMNLVDVSLFQVGVLAPILLLLSEPAQCDADAHSRMAPLPDRGAVRRA